MGLVDYTIRQPKNMPSDEANDEKPRVYQHEADTDRPILDAFGDEKCDVSRMAEDENPLAKRESTTNAASTSCPSNGARLASNGQNNSLNRSDKTAFNVVNHSPYYFYPAPLLVSQPYGFLGNRFPSYASPHAASLSSPTVGSPTYGAGAAFSGFYPHPSWFQFDVSKAGFPPVAFGVPVHAQISPNFNFGMGVEQLQLSMAAALRTQQMMDSPFHPSPLHSPDTGATIAPIGSKGSTNSAPLKLAFGNGMSGSAHGFCVPPNGLNQQSSTTDPLSSMGRIVVPMPTTSVTHIANSLASTSNVKPNQIENGVFDEKTSKTPAAKFVSSKYTGESSSKQQNHRHNALNNAAGSSTSTKPIKDSNKMPHIKKPLNAFMLYMKEMRPKVMQEAGLKERQSAEINRILGRRWHSITRDEQQKYYEMARKVRQEHLVKYPGWSARDNYAIHKKKKRKRDKAIEGLDNLEAKKCRARFGLDQQSKWCKHCRRKKKCLWFKDGDNDGTDTTTDASPPMHVTSTTQFMHGANEDPKNVDLNKINNNNNSNLSTITPDVVNSPHAIVTSTTVAESNGNVDMSSEDEDVDDDLIDSCSDYEDENKNESTDNGKLTKIITDLDTVIDNKPKAPLAKHSLTPTKSLLNT